MELSKTAIRKTMLERRKVIHDEMMRDPQECYRKLETFVFPAILEKIPPRSRIISGFYPIGSEIDCKFILLLLKEHFIICLPIVVCKDQPLIFRE